MIPSEPNNHQDQVKKKNNELTTDVLLTVRDHFKRPPIQDDRYDLLGKTIAVRLRGLEKRQRLMADKLINDVLFEGEMGTLTSQSFHSTPVYLQQHQATPTIYIPQAQGIHTFLHQVVHPHLLRFSQNIGLNQLRWLYHPLMDIIHDNSSNNNLEHPDKLLRRKQQKRQRISYLIRMIFDSVSLI